MLLDDAMPNKTSDPKRRRTPHSPWPIEELVRAQCMACEGHSLEAIARSLGRSDEEVRRRLDPEPSPDRQEFAGVGYRHLKYR
jgi:hypothetical protein